MLTMAFGVASAQTDTTAIALDNGCAPSAYDRECD